VSGATTQFIDDCLRRAREGDQEAINALLARSYERLSLIARKQLRGYPTVGRFASTYDVLHDSMLRLQAKIEKNPPRSPGEFFGVAAEFIRFQLTDTLRHFRGRHRADDSERAPGQKHRVDLYQGVSADAEFVLAKGQDTYDPVALEKWTEFHEAVENLPPDLRQVCDLMFYHGLNQAEAAEVAEVSVKTIRKRWRTARRLLADKLPEDDI
jgi:RNA polymerase sigma-70 factor (ECF subfamily)